MVEKKSDKKKTVKTAKVEETKKEKKPVKRKTTTKKTVEKPIRRKLTKEELEVKAKELAEKIEGKIQTSDIKEEVEKSRKTLVPVEEYIKSGIYIGTKVITPHVRPFVYRRRNDGIAILDINLIDKKLKEFIKEFVKYDKEDFIVVCKREAGWKAVNKFSELTGVRVFTKKYPAGILTNSQLPNFFETEMVLICDPWIDKNAMKDVKRIKKKVFGLCDTNNYTFDVDVFIPCNNKSGKSIGLIFYILTREYLKAKKIKAEVEIEDFIDES